ncbi:DUF4153 domain-containing protein [Nocardia sp. MW-W600-9]
MTESTTPRTPDRPVATATATKTEPAPAPAASPGTAPQPWTAGGQAAAVTPPTPAMPPLPPPPPPVYRRWHHVARPAGVLPAAAVAGIVGATVIPLDRPGIGWVLTGGVIAGALGVVDYRARSRSSAEPDGDSSTSTTPVGTAATTDADTTPAPSPTASSPSIGSPATGSAEPVVPTPAVDSRDGGVAASPEDSAATDRSGSAGSGATSNTPARVPDSSVDADPASEESGTVTCATADNRDPAPDNPAVVTSKATDSAQRQSTSEAAEGDSSTEANGEPTPVVAGSPTAGDRPASATTAAVTSGRPDGTSATAEPVTARHRLWWTIAAITLLGVGTFRAAGWLFVLCVLAACVAGSLAVLGRRSSRGIVHDMVAVPLASFAAVRWAFSGLRGSRTTEMSSVRRYGASVAVTAALLVVFVPLLGGADATFAELLSGLVPSIDAATAWQWIVLFAVIGMGALGGLYLLAGPLAAAGSETRPVRLWSRSEWVLPVGALTVLFGVFLGAQFVALFGGDDYVQRTAGLTYAEYARSGFWQLSAVSILTLAVILAVLHWASQETAADRRWLRILLSAVSVLALVIVGSALARMWTYQQAYGFTVLRLLVEVCELWVGLVYVLVLVAIARLRWNWVPRAAVGTALGTLIALAVLDPEHLVADRNIARWEHGKRLDTDYLSTLSPDILPALTRLPAELRADIEDPIRADLEDDHWWSWNLSRSSAR